MGVRLCDAVADRVPVGGGEALQEPVTLAVRLSVEEADAVGAAVWETVALELSVMLLVREALAVLLVVGVMLSVLAEAVTEEEGVCDPLLVSLGVVEGLGGTLPVELWVHTPDSVLEGEGDPLEEAVEDRVAVAVGEPLEEPLEDRLAVAVAVGVLVPLGLDGKSASPQPVVDVSSHNANATPLVLSGLNGLTAPTFTTPG